MAGDVRLSLRHWLIPLLIWNAVLVGILLLPYLMVWLINQRTQSATDEYGMPIVHRHFLWIDFSPSVLIRFLALGNGTLACAHVLRLWIGRSSRKLKQNNADMNKGVDQFVVKESISVERLLGKKLMAVYAVHWQSEACNLARFILELDGGVCITWNEKPPLHVSYECQVVQRDLAWGKVQQIQYDSREESRILGHVIVDILMPSIEDARNADSYVIEMSSGIGLAQVSGEPIGILPAVYLCEIDRAALISLCNREKS